ncbi:MAG TPA: hypothetical protein VIJ25_10370 [Methylococcales bacterium]
MQFIQGLLTNKLLAAILVVLVLDLGGVSLHFKQEADELAQTNRELAAQNRAREVDEAAQSANLQRAMRQFDTK